jgi:hypothetical protein
VSCLFEEGVILSTGRLSGIKDVFRQDGGE